MANCFNLFEASAINIAVRMINGGHDATAQLALASALNDCAVTTTKAGIPRAIQNRAVGLALIRHIATTASPAITGPTTPIWLMINSRLRLTDKTVSSRLALSPKWPTVTKPLFKFHTRLGARMAIAPSVNTKILMGVFRACDDAPSTGLICRPCHNHQIPSPTRK